MTKEKKHSKKFDYSSADLLIYIWKQRIPLIIITGAAIVLSVIASLLITPMYKSSVVLFPSSGAAVSQILSISHSPGRSGVYELGEEEQAERLLQVLNSNEIRDKVIKKFNLVEHYGFNSDTKYLNSKMATRYKSNLKFKRTPFHSVVIEVMDKDPELTAAIANEVTSLIDTVYHRIIKQRAREAFLLVENEYMKAQASISSLEDSLIYYSKLGINDYVTQAERYHEAYGKAIVEGNLQAARIIEGKLSLLSTYGTQYLSLRTRLTHDSERLSLLKQRYNEAKVEYEQRVPYTFIVNSAEIPDKKAYPKKSVIVMLSALSAFLSGLIALIVFDNIRKKI